MGALLLGAAREGVVAVLPFAVFVTFMCYTSVCAQVFGAFRCETFSMLKLPSL